MSSSVPVVKYGSFPFLASDLGVILGISFRLRLWNCSKFNIVPCLYGCMCLFIFTFQILVHLIFFLVLWESNLTLLFPPGLANCSNVISQLTVLTVNDLQWQLWHIFSKSSESVVREVCVCTVTASSLLLWGFMETVYVQHWHHRDID